MMCAFVDTQKDKDTINDLIKEQIKSSFIINDPDGRTYENCKDNLDGYKVEIIGFGDNTKSYNPFSFVKNEKDVKTLAHSITENCIADEGFYIRDPFWLNLTTDLTEALISMTCLKDYGIDKSFEGLIEYIDKYPTKEIRDFIKDNTIKGLSDRTFNGALTTVKDRLERLNNNFYSKQNEEFFDLEKALSEKTAIFIRYPEEMNINSYVNIIQSQIKEKDNIDFCFFVSHNDHIFRK